MHQLLKIVRLSLFLLVCASMTGCVAGRRTVALETPEIPKVSKNGLSFYVTSVVDERIFQNRPSDPSIPSIDGDVRMLSAAEKSRMIGRQRNGFGKAMGDIALPEEDSVNNEIKLLLAEGFKSLGYFVGDLESADLSIDAKINEFWAWFSPGAFTVEFHAKLKCSITIKGEDINKHLVVEGSGINIGQVASDGNWKLAYTRASEDFIKNFVFAVTGEKM